MDPDALLERLRVLVDAVLDGDTPAEQFHADAEALAADFEGLDLWLSKGGFLPEAWKR